MVSRTHSFPTAPAAHTFTGTAHATLPPFPAAHAALHTPAQGQHTLHCTHLHRDSTRGTAHPLSTLLLPLSWIQPAFFCLASLFPLLLLLPIAAVPSGLLLWSNLKHLLRSFLFWPHRLRQFSLSTIFLLLTLKPLCCIFCTDSLRFEICGNFACHPTRK